MKSVSKPPFYRQVWSFSDIIFYTFGRKCLEISGHLKKKQKNAKEYLRENTLIVSYRVTLLILQRLLTFSVNACTVTTVVNLCRSGAP